MTFSASTVLHAQEPVSGAQADVSQQVVPFELRPSTPDDELLEVARAADVNLFVDATDLPQQASQVQTQWPGKQDWGLWNLVTQIAAGRRVAWQIQNGDRALLFAAEPNLEKLRQDLMNGPGIEIATSKLDAAAFNARLLDYLRQEHGWKGDAADWSKTIRITDLPADLKPEVLARAQQEALGDSEVNALRATLSDASWQQARLRIAPSRETGETGAALLLDTPTPTGYISFKLSPLPQPRAQGGR